MKERSKFIKELSISIRELSNSTKDKKLSFFLIIKLCNRVCCIRELLNWIRELSIWIRELNE